MRIRGLDRSFRRATAGPIWTPRQNWPTAASPGFWLDPTSFSNIYQDSAGASQATAVEQPAGLMLDKRYGLALGPERVLNGSFEENTNGWTPTAGLDQQWAAGEMRLTTNGVGYTSQSNGAAIESGKTYKIGSTIRPFTADGLPSLLGRIQFTSGFSGFLEPSISTSRIDIATSNLLVMQAGVASSSILAGSGAYSFFDNISVRELPGNHARQATTTARPTVSARVNLLTKTRDFSDPIWVKSGISVNTTATANEFRIVASTDNSVHSVKQTVSASYNLPYMSLEVKADGARYIAIGNSEQSGAFSSFDLQTGLKGFNTTLGRIDALGDGWYRIICKPFVDNSNNASAAWHIRLVNDLVSNPNLATFAGDGVSGVIIRNPQYQPVLGPVATVAHPRYQWVNTSTDYDTAGFPKYLSFDGLDDGLSTGPITLGSDMDVFLAISIAAPATDDAIISESGGGRYLLALGGAGPIQAGAGAPTYAVNGALKESTRASVGAAVPVGSWVVIEIRNANLSAWPTFSLSGWTPYVLAQSIAGCFACPAGSEATRAKNRKWLGSKVGLSL